MEGEGLGALLPAGGDGMLVEGTWAAGWHLMSQTAHAGCTYLTIQHCWCSCCICWPRPRLLQ
jgi:hypothetical protein